MSNPFTVAGSAATRNIGTAAGNLVALDDDAKLPAVDGSQLTNLPSGGTATTIRFDDFYRSDSTTSLGAPADGGSAWETNGSTWGIAAAQAYTPTSTAEAYAVLDAARADVEVTVTLPVAGNFAGLVFRYSDADNQFVVDSWARLLFLQRTAGSIGAIATSYAPTSSGDKIRVRAFGADIRAYHVYADGTIAERLRMISAFNVGATKHGIRSNVSTGIRLDDFLVTSVQPPPALRRLVSDGNSQGIVPTPDQAWPGQFLVANLPWSVAVTNVAGQTIAQRASAFDADVVPYLEAQNVKNVVVFTEVINSVYYGRTGAQVWSDLQTYAAKVRAKGAKLVFITPQRDRADFPGTSTISGTATEQRATFVSEVANFMALFYANSSVVCDAYFDVYADARFQPSNTTFISSSDDVHWTPTASGVVAAAVSTLIASL